MEKILPLILTTAIIKQAEGVSQSTAQTRLSELKGVCGKAKPTVFQYFEHNHLTPQEVAFSFGQTYAQRYKEAQDLGL